MACAIRIEVGRSEGGADRGRPDESRWTDVAISDASEVSAGRLAFFVCTRLDETERTELVALGA